MPNPPQAKNCLVCVTVLIPSDLARIVRNMELGAPYEFLRILTRKWFVPPYFKVCAVIIITRVHVIGVPLARMEFWHMEVPYANPNRP